jgi:hypothetical protein
VRSPLLARNRRALGANFLLPNSWDRLKGVINELSRIERVARRERGLEDALTAMATMTAWRC